MRLAPYQRRLLDYIFPAQFDRLPFTTVLWSEPKKSGKSALAAAIGRWWSERDDERYNEIYCCANDFEQAQGRNYAAIRRSIELARSLPFGVPDDVASGANAWKVTGRTMTYQPNGTFVQALSGDYAGAAGGNPGMILFSELWGYISEASRRLYGEMTTVPTRKNSFRWVETYAGWEGESEELEKLYRLGLAGEPVEEFADLRSEDGNAEVYGNRRAGVFMFWSHTQRQPWQLGEVGERYYAEQRATLRPAEFRRFHRNEWTSREGGFIEASEWDVLETPGVLPLEDLLARGERVELILAADAAKNRDCAALIGVIPQGSKLDLAYVGIFRPKADDELGGQVLIDLDETIGAELYRLVAHPQVNVSTVAYDPYQLHSIMTTFAKKNKSIEVAEIPQTEQRVKSDTALRDLIMQKRLQIFFHKDLREHVLNAVAIERPRGLRLDKEATTKKIDGAVALSMATWAALYHVPKKRVGFIKV